MTIEIDMQGRMGVIAMRKRFRGRGGESRMGQEIVREEGTGVNGIEENTGERRKE